VIQRTVDSLKFPYSPDNITEGVSGPFSPEDASQWFVLFWPPEEKSKPLE
jgi:hypothetical protein